MEEQIMATDVTTLKGIEQGRATFAFKAVQGVSEDMKKKYKTAAKKAPVLVKTNGLGQTLAYIKSKGGKINPKTEKKEENGYDIFYDQIGKWLCSDAANQSVPDGELVKEVIQLESHEYRQVTVETLALLNWMRRFVDGLMKDVEEDNE